MSDLHGAVLVGWKGLRGEALESGPVAEPVHHVAPAARKADQTSDKRWHEAEEKQHLP